MRAPSRKKTSRPPTARRARYTSLLRIVELLDGCSDWKAWAPKYRSDLHRAFDDLKSGRNLPDGYSIGDARRVVTDALNMIPNRWDSPPTDEVRRRAFTWPRVRAALRREFATEVPRVNIAP